MLQLLRLRMRRVDGPEPAAAEANGSLRHVADEGQSRSRTQR